MDSPRCRICEVTSAADRYDVREMMFGFRDRFSYFQCASCGCLQIAEFPAEISRYYPESYYSFPRHFQRRKGVRKALRTLRVRQAFFGKNPLGWLLARRFPYQFEGVREWLARTNATPDSRILDVGCGSGELLHDMRTMGFRHLLGIDPYVEADVHYGEGFSILKRTIHELDGTFDLIMFHHALEHIPDQLETLAAAAQRLAPEGRCLIRIPTVSSYAWEHYRENWVQLDAPRHFFLHSIQSLQLLAERAGLALCEVRYDSNEIQFLGSELYARDVPLQKLPETASRREVRHFRRRAEALNAAGRGDQAAFYFRRV